MKQDKEVSAYIGKAADEQTQLMEQLRQLIHESVAGTTEAIKWGFPVFSKTKNFTYIRLAQKHITLGFYNPDKIDDPDNILEGTGNTLRHIKIRKQEDINKLLLTRWLKAIAE